MSTNSSSSYLGEIRMFGGNFAPKNWEFCDGKTLSISDYHDLYLLIGVTYGGDGVSNFALPDLRGRVPVHHGTAPGLSSYRLGQKKGEEAVTLSADYLPEHTHSFYVSTYPAKIANPQECLIAIPEFNFYKKPEPSDQRVALASESIASAGSSQPHNNLQPYTCINFIICVNVAAEAEAETKTAAEKAMRGTAEGENEVLMDQFIGEIRMFPYSFTPKGWYPCDGRLLNVTDQPAFSTILSTNFGGDGVYKFGLPNIIGRIPMHRSGSHQIGKQGGNKDEQLSLAQMPTHTHRLMAINETADSKLCGQDAMIAHIDTTISRTKKTYRDTMTNLVNMYTGCIDPSGASGVHSNVMPCLSLQYCIAYKGTYPPRS
jgi:microcystin-dependent protein